MIDQQRRLKGNFRKLMKNWESEEACKPRKQVFQEGRRKTKRFAMDLIIRGHCDLAKNCFRGVVEAEARPGQNEE